MSIALRVLSGSRAGARLAFEKSVIALGRHPLSDVTFDVERDLDVSARHAEIRGIDGRYVIVDSASTNGTFVNGRRVSGEQTLADGDEVSFGEHGPRVVVEIPARSIAAAASAPATRHAAPAQAAPVPAHEPGTDPRGATAVRVAMAVQAHTRGLRRMLTAAVVVLGAGICFAYWLGHRESRRQIADLMQIVTQNERASEKLEGELSRIGATSYAAAIRQQNATLRTRVEGTTDSPREFQALRSELRRSQIAQQGLALMDLSAISARNDSAVAFLVSELDGKPFGGTAFGITTSGLLVTNRHNVRSDAGNPPTRIAVKFANTDRYLHARLVKVSEDKDLDLALVQVEDSGTYPVIAGVKRSLDDLKVGAPVVTIGFPHSLDTPQEGETVKTSLEGGTVSKRLDALLQIDSYAGHGSSGSPIFDVHGYVVGVVWGGESESQGRIVYAVPSDRLAAFLPNEARTILR